MNRSEILETAFSMPLTNPAYPRGPYRFINREYLVITYETDIDALKRIVPEPLEVTDPVVKFEFIRMPDSTGFSDYSESGQVIPVSFQGKKGAWTGPASLHLIPHAMAQVAELPVKKVISATHILTDLTLPYGKVIHDYL